LGFKELYRNNINPQIQYTGEPIILQIKARVLFCGEGPHSRCYGRTVAMKLILQPCDEDDWFFPCNGAPVEWNWQGKTEILGEKPVPMPLCPPQIPHGLTRDRTRARAVRGRRLTAWTMVRPQRGRYVILSSEDNYVVQDLSSSQRCCWKFKYCGLWRSVVIRVAPDVSEDLGAFILWGSPNELPRGKIRCVILPQGHSITSQKTLNRRQILQMELNIP
jgi:hypothetical protein